MLELQLLRHAKSDWDASFNSDRERPLNKRGTRAAAAVGAFLAACDRTPDLILSSPAVRARTTVDLAAEAGGWRAPIREIPQLYSGGPGDLLQAVQGVDDAGRILVAGHEPTMSTAVSRIVGGGSFQVPTAALVEFRFPSLDWSSVAWGRGELFSFTRARTLVRAGYGS